MDDTSADDDVIKGSRCQGQSLYSSLYYVSLYCTPSRTRHCRQFSRHVVITVFIAVLISVTVLADSLLSLVANLVCNCSGKIGVNLAE
jgi:hypothetical protein